MFVFGFYRVNLDRLIVLQNTIFIDFSILNA